METLQLNDENLSECAARAAEVLRSDGVVLYPTDTLYGLGADALSDDAVDKIYAIKGREERKPVHCIVADLTMAAKYAEINQFVEMFAKAFLPGPLTLILHKKNGVQTGIARAMATIGVRIPKNNFCLEMVRQFGGPITTTSANRSGQAPAFDTREILAQLHGGIGIDLTIDAGILPEREPSTVVDVSGTEPIILREGAILASEIWEALRVDL